MRKLLVYFFPRTISGVMASFQKVVDDLHKVAAKHVAQTEALEIKLEDIWDKADELQDRILEAETEAVEALKLATKITDNFGLVLPN